MAGRLMVLLLRADFGSTMWTEVRADFSSARTTRNARPPSNASGQARSATTGCTRIIVVRRPRDNVRHSGLSARQFVELPARFEQDWHVGIGVLPAGEKRLVRGAAAYDVAGQGERAPQLQA